MEDHGATLEQLFDTKSVHFLRQLAAAAAAADVRLFLVGGVVRDRLLGRPPLELDLLVEGNGLAFAQTLERDWRTLFPALPPPSTVTLFRRYRTARLVFTEELLPGISKLDFASARQETYPCPAQAPEVTWTDAAADLWRRDFSVNAMALELVASGDTTLLDPCAGRRDLQLRQLRVLHQQSFRDDPARLLRALRFAERLDLDLEAQTKKLFDQAVAGAFLTLLPPARLLDEVRKTLEEVCYLALLERLDALGLLKQIWPTFSLSLFRPSLSDVAGGTVTAKAPWLVTVAQLFQRVERSELHRFASHFSLTRTQIAELTEAWAPQRGERCT